ncbi:MAG: hypothetical protein IJ773_14255 [Lachnospiraceae bacterium]|nr:hypothetical protein [Lachnospiraceae bacterium]
MQITTSYTVPIMRQLIVVADNKKETKLAKKHMIGDRQVDEQLMRQTEQCCMKALHLCVDIFLKEWDTLGPLPTTAKKGCPCRKRTADCMIHTTKDNKAKYTEFDEQNPGMTSNTRRALISKALGMVSSYKSNLANWQALKPDERGAEPTLGFPERYELTFYKQDREVCDIEKGYIGLKLYSGKVWEWYYFKIKPSDAKYIAHLIKTRSLLSPVIDKVKGRYQIRFSFEENKKLVSDKEPLTYTVLGVDLGINSPASWCVMTADGTVHAKGVIHLKRDEDHLEHRINRKRMYQSEGKKSHSIYRLVNHANDSLSIDTCRAIMDVAVLYNVDCIVFEHLDNQSKIKGKKYRERIHLWRAIEVQKRVELHAHRNCMRISRVCAWGTSKYAFDGSGEVTRGEKAGLNTYSVCRFPNGKVYNCDLSAAQNISARYFLREYAKLYPDAGLPATPQRTYTTLYDFVKSIAA